MKRPLGVIGLTYLVTLAVIFHFYSFWLTAVLAVAAVVVTAAAFICRFVLRQSRVYAYALAVGLSVFGAILSLFLFQNINVRPVLTAYADREITVEGYVTDDIHIQNTFVTYTLQTEKINGKDVKTKISLTTFGNYDFEPFDGVSATFTPHQAMYSYSLSRGIYLYATEEDGHPLHATGEKHVSPYSLAVAVREWIRQRVNISLDSEAADLVNAVLLGDKRALSDDVRRAFSQTGMSYLIVVSGMHLSIVTLLLRWLFKRLEDYTRLLPFIAITLFVFCFAAVTGFTPSVMRAGWMLVIAYLGKLVLRDNDGVNSLGIAALILTVWNPYAVGDIGMLLSFAATFGILLWAEKINRFCIRAFRLTPTPSLSLEPSVGERLLNLLKRGLRWFVSFAGTSLAAMLWVIPITVVFFGTVTPLTIIVCFAAYPLTFMVLILSVLFVALPFLSGLIVPLLNVCAHSLVAVVKWFAATPYATVTADEGFYYLWLAVTAVLVVVGYIIRGSRRYVFFAVLLSALTLTVSGSLTFLLADESAWLTVYRFGSGYTATVSRGNNLSFLSCGGTAKGKNTVSELLRRNGEIDNIILADKNRRNTAYLAAMLQQADVDRVISYAPAAVSEAVAQEDLVLIDDNTRFSVVLNKEVTVEVVCVGKKVYQYLRSPAGTALLVPQNAKLRLLPEELRQADVVLLEGKAENVGVLDCGEMLALSDQADDRAEVLPNGAVYRMKLS